MTEFEEHINGARFYVYQSINILENHRDDNSEVDDIIGRLEIINKRLEKLEVEE